MFADFRFAEADAAGADNGNTPLRTRQRIARCVKDGAVVVVGQQIG